MEEKPGKLRLVVITTLLGLASGSLYTLLFYYQDTLTEFAERTRVGEKLYAAVPIVIALVFSFVHGAFTARFWDLLGLKAKEPRIPEADRGHR